MRLHKLSRVTTVSDTAIGGTAVRIAVCGVAAALALTACSSSKAKNTAAGGSQASGGGLSGATFTVSSKDFSESIVLGKITEEVLKNAGAKVVDKTNIKGSAATRTALTSGDVDMYWDYTGTGWITYLKNTKPIADPKAQYDAVKAADAKNGIAWLDPAPMNNTYAFAIKTDKATSLNVKMLSDLGALSKSNPAAATFCIESEFSTRDDGFPGMTKAYGISVPKSNVKLLDTGVIYSQTAKGSTCNFGEVFATDGRIKSLGLTVLEDDKHFFPNYNAALTMKQTLLGKYPSLATLFAPIAAKLDNAAITELNSKIDNDGEDAGDVAKAWLQDNGFLK